MSRFSRRGGNPRKKKSSAVQPAAAPAALVVVKPEALPQVKAAAKRVSKKKNAVAVVPAPIVVASNASSQCVAQTLKKYRERPSPPYSAADCCGMTLAGNDGKMYASVANVKGICTWKPVKN